MLRHGNRRGSAADSQIDYAAEQTVGFGGSIDADCVWVDVEVSCSSVCGRMVAVAAEDQFGTTLDHVEIDVCDDYVAKDCPPVPIPDCEPPALGCVEGRLSRTLNGPASASVTGAKRDLNGCTLQQRTRPCDNGA